MATTETITLQVDATGAEQLFANLAAVLGKNTGEVIRGRTPTLARYLASATMPVDVAGIEAGGFRDGTAGTRSSTRKMGQAAALGELGEMFTEVRSFTPHPQRSDLAIVTAKTGRTFLAALEKCVGDAARLQEIHRRDRRFSRRKPASTGWLAPTAILKPYRAKIAGRVGYAKSGWFNAALPFGQARVPAWMRQPDAPGRSRDHSRSRTYAYVDLINAVPYADTILTSRHYLGAIAAFGRALEKEVAHVFAASIAAELKGGR